MAEYYPLLSKAVSGLRDAPPEKRTAIYDRARQALLGQLRSMEQANEELIERERKALDEAIRRVEAEIAPPAAPPAAEAKPPAPVPMARPAPRPERPLGTTLPPRPAFAPRPPIAPGGQAPASGAAASPPRPYSIPPRPAVPPRPAPAAAAPAAPPAPAVRERIPITAGPPTIRASRSDDGPPVPPLPVAPTLEIKPVTPVPEAHAFDDALAAAGERPQADGDADLSSPRPSDAAVRPAAPRQPEHKEKLNPRILIVAFVAALVVAGIGYTAWRLRDRPEALARAQAARQAALAKDPQPGKISNRVDGAASQPPVIGPDKSASGEAPAPAAAVTDGSPSSQASANPPATTPDQGQPPATGNPPTSSSDTAASASPDRTAPQPNPAPAPAPSGQAAAAASSNADLTTATPASPTSLPANPSVPVSQRAALLVEAPDEPNKLKTYVGTVVWTSDNVSQGGGQPISTSVRAEVDIPDAHLKLSMLVQKNFESQFPASHTIELRFAPQPGNTLGDVKQIEVPQLRKDDAPLGDPLAGLPVTITNNVFLVGLSRGEVVARNLDLLQSRNWIDVPCRLANDKVAKITFEKGASGEKLLNDAIQSWQ